MFAKSRLALLVGWVTGSLAFPLLAQDTPNTDTVVVTSQLLSGATKLATPDVETPQSVSIVTRGQFEEQGATSVRQAVSYTPGVYSNQIGASSRFDYIVLRGFSDGSLDNIYLDDDGRHQLPQLTGGRSVVPGKYRSGARPCVGAVWPFFAGRDRGVDVA